MRKIVPTIIILILVIGLGFVFIGGSDVENSTTKSSIIQNGEIKENFQYVTIIAKGGYSPEVSTAKADVPTKLIIKTDGTYDCSASLVIRSLGYQKILAQTGEETIDLGTPKAGESLQGVCSMGMYSFVINFN